MEEERKFKVQKFNSQNYQLWKIQMEDYLYRKDSLYCTKNNRGNDEHIG